MMLKAPVPDDCLRAIGRITVNFVLLEQSIAFLVWQLIGAQQRVGQAITSELSFRQLVALASSLHRQFDVVGDASDQLEEILNRAVKAEENRNRIIHSFWGPGHTSDSITRIKTTAKKAAGLKHQFEQMRAADLDGVADSMAAVADEIQRFMFGE